MSEKSASAAKTEAPADKTDHTSPPVTKPVEVAPKTEATQNKPKADDNQDTPK